MADDAHPVYLERASYRRRRLEDAARLAPFFGVFLLILPALWASDSRTADAMIYVFTVWGILIVLMAVVSPRLASGEDKADSDAPDKER